MVYTPFLLQYRYNHYHFLSQYVQVFDKYISYKIDVGWFGCHEERLRESGCLGRWKPYDLVCIGTGWLGDRSVAISLKRIDLAPPNFATYYPSQHHIRLMCLMWCCPSIWTRYSNENISRETNKFMKEPPDILGPCFWYIEIHRVWPIFGRLNHYIYPNKAILSEVCINVARNMQNAPNISFIWGDTVIRWQRTDA